jgi:hypothetical protein
VCFVCVCVCVCVCVDSGSEQLEPAAGSAGGSARAAWASGSMGTGESLHTMACVYSRLSTGLFVPPDFVCTKALVLG